YAVSAEEWLIRMCGRHAYEVFWRPLLRAKFGTFYDQVAAVFIWATLTRLFGARSAATAQETMGYVRGGYRRSRERCGVVLRERGATIRVGTPVVGIEPRERGCEVAWQPKGGARTSERFDQVFFTGPTRLARSIVGAQLAPLVERAERD